MYGASLTKQFVGRLLAFLVVEGALDPEARREARPVRSTTRT